MVTFTIILLLMVAIYLFSILCKEKELFFLILDLYFFLNVIILLFSIYVINVLKYYNILNIIFILFLINFIIVLIFIYKKAKK